MQKIAYPRCSLTVVRGADQGAKIDSEKVVIRIGSASDNDLVIHDPAVSRHHLEVRRDRGEYAITDLGSTNGTFVGSVRVKDAGVRGRVDLRVGGTIVRVEPVTAEIEIAPSASARLEGLVGGSASMRQVYGIIEHVAPTDLPVLITGEAGTGKELTARTIHAKSVRANGPFVTLDLSTQSPTQVESALFGHEKTEVPGSDSAYAGAFERAHGGTLYLEAVNDLPVTVQLKLLHAIERGEIERLRGEVKIRVDVRVIASTHRDLDAMTKSELFRTDLLQQLATVRIALPPIRDRKEDIRTIVEHFLSEVAPELSPATPARTIHARALETILQSDLPGNVRQLVNVLKRAAASAKGEEIQLENLPADMAQEALPSEDVGWSLRTLKRSDIIPLVAGKSLRLKDAKQRLIDRFERQYLETLLATNGFNVSRTAKEAGIGRRHLHRLIVKYGLVEHIRDFDVNCA